MPDIKDYTGKITSEHAGKPKYMAMVETVSQCFLDTNQVVAGLPDDFDLDLANDAQLDDVGLWVGISRNIPTPLTNVYFALDTVGLGFDQGAWKGPFDPDNGITILDNEAYRLLIRAKIGANHWDGTLEQSKGILDLVFNGDTYVFIEDNQDMTISIGLAGGPPSAIQWALLTGGYITPKPQSVKVKYFYSSSTSGPLFGLDVSNQYIAGFDQGSWGNVYS
ncbi:hypothetical protein D3C76_886420 [compost metagenome]|jgi:hypothetical protein